MFRKDFAWHLSWFGGIHYLAVSWRVLTQLLGLSDLLTGTAGCTLLSCSLSVCWALPCGSRSSLRRNVEMRDGCLKCFVWDVSSGLHAERGSAQRKHRAATAAFYHCSKGCGLAWQPFLHSLCCVPTVKQREQPPRIRTTKAGKQHRGFPELLVLMRQFLLCTVLAGWAQLVKAGRFALRVSGDWLLGESCVYILCVLSFCE